ncbi:MAG: DUF1993 domain-containing protein [Ketobacteraceae bacterium]|nr:DUF1993 domain-containing protein [Ketobacteraceae bacterium]
MSISIYQTTIPVYINALNNLSSILDKAVAYADEKGIDLDVLVNYRLAVDMHSLPRQVQIATDTAKGCGARLTGVEPPVYEDTETTFPELKQRIEKTVDYLKSLDFGEFEGAEEREVQLKLPSRTIDFNGLSYVNHFVTPNFFFHITTAYCILRHAGVPVGKMDFLGGK